MRALPRAGLRPRIAVTLSRTLRQRCLSNSTTRLSVISLHLRPLSPIPWDNVYDEPSPKPTNESLLSLVHSGRYEAAALYRLKLIDNAIPIEPHPLYEDAAIAAWRKTADLDIFATWLRLVPKKADERPNSSPFMKSRQELLRSGGPAEIIPAIIRFAIICASKGYGDLVWHEVVLLLSRFATQEEASLFLLKFEIAVKRYTAKNLPHLEQAKIIIGQRKRTLDVCCHAEWLDTAMQIVQHSQGMPIFAQCQLLLQKLQERNDQANVMLLKTLMNKEGWMSPLYLRAVGHNETSGISVGTTIPIMDSLPSKSEHIPAFYGEAKLPGADRRTIALRLKRTKNYIRRRQPPTDSLQYLRTVYESTPSVQGNAISILRRQALAMSDSCAERWLCDELRFFTFQKKYSDLVATFDANFHSDFLPSMPYNSIKETILPQISTQSPDIVPTKLTMKSTDGYLIWNALIHLSLSLPSSSSFDVLQQLYFSLLRYCNRLTTPEFRGSHPAYPAAFRSCIYAFGVLGHPSLAASVLDDMTTPAVIGGSRKGPDRRHHEMLGYVYAKAGMEEDAMKVLSSIEDDNHPTRGSPKLSTYGMIMEGFLEAGLVEAAVAVRDRMKRRMRYVPDKNDRLEEVLKALEVAIEAKTSVGPRIGT